MASNLSGGSIFYCQDRHSTTDVKRVKPGEDTTDLQLPADAAVIDRNAPIAVCRSDPTAGPISPSSVETIQFVGGQGSPATVNPDPVVYAERPPPSDKAIGMYADITERPIDREAPDVVIPEAPVPPQETVSIRPPAQAAPVVAVPSRVAKKKVTIRNASMGRIQAKVDLVSISDTLIMLGFVDDDDAVIVEPPAKGSTEAVIITYEGVEYTCYYFGFTTSLDIRLDSRDAPIFLVVFNRDLV